MGRRLIGIGAAALCLAGAMSLALGEEVTPARTFAATKDSELSAELPEDAGWCRPDITFTIRGQDDIYFTEGETDEQGRRGRFLLQKLLGVIRVGLQSECPQAKSVTFNGFVDDVFVYRGYASRDNKEGEWVLLDVPVGLVQAPDPLPAINAAAPVPKRASIGECDALSAHPDDPMKPDGVKGISDDDLHAGKALAVCEEALSLDPYNPRLKFQLARACLLYDKADRGVELMIEAAEAGHGAALAALAELSGFGRLKKASH